MVGCRCAKVARPDRGKTELSTPMPPQIRLHPSQVADLAEIRDTPPNLLMVISEHLLKADPRPMRA
jgi:hypothetical protein